MKLHELKSKKQIKPKKRIGRGGKRGTFSGRGTKGQKARSKMSIAHPHFEGGQRPLFKRLPYRRGKGNSKISKKPIIINLDAINLLPKGSTVNLESLIKHRIVAADDAEIYGVKVLGDGNLTSSYKFEVKTSKSAAKKIEKAGGQIIKWQSIKSNTEKKEEKKGNNR